MTSARPIATTRKQQEDDACSVTSAASSTTAFREEQHRDGDVESAAATAESAAAVAAASTPQQSLLPPAVDVDVAADSTSASAVIVGNTAATGGDGGGVVVVRATALSMADLENQVRKQLLEEAARVQVQRIRYSCGTCLASSENECGGGSERQQESEGNCACDECRCASKKKSDDGANDNTNNNKKKRKRVVIIVAAVAVVLLAVAACVAIVTCVRVEERIDLEEQEQQQQLQRDDPLFAFLVQNLGWAGSNEFSTFEYDGAPTPAQLAYERIKATTPPRPLNGQTTRLFVLLHLYYSTGGQQWTNATGWEEDEEAEEATAANSGNDYNFCDWYGVRCDPDGLVTGIDLRDNNLVSEIPVTLVQLSGHLERLDLSSNSLTRWLPSGLVAFEKLQYLNLSKNEIDYGFSPGMGHLPAIRTLDVSDNLLPGRLSSDDFVRLGKTIETFLINDNNFEGEIPGTISNWTNLAVARFDGNTQITGSIPAELCGSNGDDGTSAPTAAPPFITVDCENVSCDCCRCDNNDDSSGGES